MNPGLGIAAGALIGVVLGIAVSLITDVPFAPEIGLLLGGAAGWLATRERA